MDKKLMAVKVATKGGNYFIFADTATTSDGTSAARSLANHTVIDANGKPQGSTDEKHYIIPYMAIDAAITMVDYAAATAPVDDNCKVQTPAEEAESGTLKIKNATIGPDANLPVYLKLDAPATYSGIEFTEDEERPGWYVGQIESIAAGETFTIEGIPDGTEFEVANKTGTVPATVTISGSPK